ncbi:MAG: AtpZ/AtpI family protein [Flavisolibacter sp.]|nr:AtpZ/AtpI family protein [Flavisolibacter sp.]
MTYKPKRSSNTSELMRYAGLGAQLFVSIGIAVFLGYKADKWIHIRIPLLVWILPLLVLSLMIYKLIKDTSKQKSDGIEQ